jgi:large subunit ribosomal protein L4
MPVTVDVYSLERKKVGSMDLDEAVFGVPVREHLFHEVVRAQLAARRSGTAKTKRRAEVAGAAKKAYKQKGTGRARQGNMKAPHYVGGGTCWGPQPRSFALKVNRRIRLQALRAALSRRLSEGRLVVLESFELPDIKTKQVAAVLERFECPKALIVDQTNERLALSAGNLRDARYLPVEGVNVYDVLRFPTVLVTREAAAALTGRLKR